MAQNNAEDGASLTANIMKISLGMYFPTMVRWPWAKSPPSPPSVEYWLHIRGAKVPKTLPAQQPATPLTVFKMSFRYSDPGGESTVCLPPYNI
jgi:hypothetical protein